MILITGVSVTAPGTVHGTVLGTAAIGVGITMDTTMGTMVIMAIIALIPIIIVITTTTSRPITMEYLTEKYITVTAIEAGHTPVTLCLQEMHPPELVITGLQIQAEPIIPPVGLAEQQEMFREQGAREAITAPAPMDLQERQEATITVVLPEHLTDH